MSEEENGREVRMTSRRVEKSFLADEQSEGAGARVRRTIGTKQVQTFTPFLMLDHLVKTGNGFPDHPHRGQETITYVLRGNVDHEDFTGSRGTIGTGDLQFMTAGRGVMHAEMPRKDEKGHEPEILQLWVDLPRNLKTCKPRYRNLRAGNIPIARPSEKVEVKVIAGSSHSVESVQNLAYTPIVFYDCTVFPGGEVTQPIPEDFNLFIYILNGVLTVGRKQIKENHCIIFNHMGNCVTASVDEACKQPARFIIVGGQKLDQPVFQEGPFVETSKERVKKAFVDFRNAKSGFERSKGWKSKIGGW